MTTNKSDDKGDKMSEKCGFSFPALLSLLYSVAGISAFVLAFSAFPQKETVNEEIPFFEWDKVNWNDGNYYRNEAMPPQCDVTMHGKFTDYVVGGYTANIRKSEIKYTIVHDAYLGPDGRIYKNWTPFPTEYRYIQFSATNYSNKPTKNIRYFDSAIAFPVYEVLSDPCIYTLLFPILNSVPSHEFAGRRLFINRYISDTELILPKIGINFTSQVYSQYGWVYAKDLLILDPPTEEFLPETVFKAFKDKIIGHKPGELFNNNTIPFATDGDDPGSLRPHLMEELKSKTDKIQSIDLPLHMLERMDIFRDFKAFISFSSDNLHLLQFMQPGAVAIIIQPSDVFLKHVYLAKIQGVKIHVIAQDEKDISSTIIQILHDEKLL